MAEFWTKAWPMVLDKALLAGVAMLLGFVLAKRLERFKRQQTGVAELYKARVAAINDVYAALFECRDAIIDVEDAVCGFARDLIDPKGPAKTYTAASRVVARNRFLVGAEFAEVAAQCLARLGAATEEQEQQGLSDSTWANATRLFEKLEQVTPGFARLPADEMPNLQPRRAPTPK